MRGTSRLERGVGVQLWALTLCLGLGAPRLAIAAPADGEAEAKPAEPAPEEAEPKPADSPELARAKQLYGQGKTAFDTTDYNTAIEMWTEAYGASDTRQNAPIKAALIYNLATAQERAFGIDEDLTHLKRAEVLMQSYADSIPALYGDTDEAASEQGKIETRLGDVRAKIAAIEADEEAAQKAAAEAAARNGPRPETGPVDAPKPDPKAKIFIITGAALLGVGVAGLGVMAGGLVIGNQADSDIPEDIADRRDQFDRGKAGNTMAYVGGIAGGAFLAAGAVLLGLGLKRQRTGLAVAPSFGPQGAGLTLRARF